MSQVAARRHSDPARRPPDNVVARLMPPAVLTVLMWVSELVDQALGGALDRFGIQPRDVDSLGGILAAPLLHSGIPHLVANTSTFVVLGILTALMTRRFWAVTLGIVVVGGLGVWLIGQPNTVHIGASGLVYGYAAFLIAYGWFARRPLPALVAVAVFLTYGGIVWGVLPTDQRVSWEGHLFGAVAGVLMARWAGRRARRERFSTTAR